MFKKLFIILVLTLSSCLSVLADEGKVISNNFFSFKMPGEFDGTYIVNKTKNSIDIIEKTSAKSGEGGFAFGFKIFKNHADYADLEGYKKIGELTDKKGILYDMTFERPVENRCGDDEKTIENFLKLYELGTNIEINGVRGSVYNKNQGMRGEELYKEVLEKYKQAIKEHWDYHRIKQEGFGSVSNILVEDKNVSLNKIGYAYYDINSDGIDELFIGDIKKDGKTFYDLYTMVNRKPQYVYGAYYPDESHYVCNDRYLCKETRIAKDKNIFTVRTLGINSTKRPLVVEYLYNEMLNKQNPWFRTYSLDDQYESISKKTYNQGISTFNGYKKFDYIPLSRLDN